MARKTHGKKLSGGKIRSAVIQSAGMSGPGYKRGGALSAMAEEQVDGGVSDRRADKRARGGRTGSPFSAAHSTSDRHGKGMSGHEGE